MGSRCRSVALTGGYAHTRSPDFSMLCSGAGGVLAFVVYLLLSLGRHSGSLLSHPHLLPDQYGSDGNESALQMQLPAGAPVSSSPAPAVPAQPEAMRELSSTKLGEGKGPPVSRAGRTGNFWGMAEPKDGAATGEQQVLLQSSSSVPSRRIQCGQSSAAAGQCQADSRSLPRRTFPSHSRDTSVC